MIIMDYDGIMCSNGQLWVGGWGGGVWGGVDGGVKVGDVVFLMWV